MNAVASVVRPQISAYTRIVHGDPPPIEGLAEAFPRRPPGVVYAYDDKVYVPVGVDLPRFLLAHEQVHLDRQKVCGVREWWAEYIKSPSFRYREEEVAHAAEYLVRSQGANRNQRRVLLDATVRRLLAPFYKYRAREAPNFPNALKNLKRTAHALANGGVQV